MQDLYRRIHAAVNGDLPPAGSRRLGPYQGIRPVLASLRLFSRVHVHSSIVH